ncbi:MAG TPA: ATP-binding cassette domain-containing protein [Candidatus Limnocylindrales bacterium]
MRIEVIGASLRFGRRVVFADLDAVFPAGVVTALTGPSGSGKSSLLAAMSGYLRLTRGSVVTVDDDDRRSSPKPVDVAWVPQGTNSLGARSALDNVMIGALAEGDRLPAARRRALDALEAVGLWERAGAVVRTLSGGELQRVGFARALATSKPLIFADEPSSALDAANTHLLADLLAGLNTRATVVVATHDPVLIDAAHTRVDLRERTLDRVDDAR